MKKALVLAGGGARGAYEIGVWMALKELDYNYDIITGTSVGALNAALMIQGDIDFARSIWDEIETSKILDVAIPMDMHNKISSYRSFIFEIIKQGGIDYTPLKNLLTNFLDEDKIRSSPIDFGIVTVEFPSFKPYMLFKEDIPYGQMKDYLLASSACFPAMKSHVINGTQYIDGGYYDNMPIQMAVDRGAKEIIAVNLDGPGRKRIPQNNDIQMQIITPVWPLGDILIFDSKTSRKNIKLGYLDTMKAFGRFEGVRYSFKLGEGEILINNMYDDFASFLHDKFSITEGKPKHKAEERARISIARCLRKKWGKPIDRRTTIVAAAEITAEIFNIDPFNVYTINEFNKELHKAIKKSSKTSRKNALDNLQSVLNPKHRVLNLARSMAKNGSTDVLTNSPGIAALIPLDFVAATYINVMGLI